MEKMFKHRPWQIFSPIIVLFESWNLDLLFVKFSFFFFLFSSPPSLCVFFHCQVADWIETSPNPNMIYFFKISFWPIHFWNYNLTPFCTKIFMILPQTYPSRIHAISCRIPQVSSSQICEKFNVYAIWRIRYVS